jgi:hypothetical protein
MIHLRRANITIRACVPFINENMNLKKRKQRKWLCLPLFLLILTGCEKVVYEPVVITNDTIYFAKDIQVPILQEKCTSCHPPTKGLDLNASTAYDALVPKYAAPADTSNPEGSKLYIKLTGTSHSPRTSDPDKQKILKWISQGVLDN